MQLFIMRHGEAQNFIGQGTLDDSQRALTSAGKKEAQTMADWFEQNQISPKQVFVSPYVRAQQTCGIVTATMQTLITTLDFITPSGNAKQVHDYFDGVCSDSALDLAQQNLLIVSHMPLVSYLVAELTQSENAPIFATAGIAQINYDVKTMKGELVAMISPSDFN